MRWFGKAPEAVKGFMAWVGFVSWFFAIPIGGAMMAYLLSLFQRVPPWGIALGALFGVILVLLIWNLSTAAASHARLKEYESLEREIMGLLADGLEHVVKFLPINLGIANESGVEKRMRLAIGNLLNAKMIEPTGHIDKRIRCARTFFNRE